MALAPLRDPELVAGAIAAAVGVGESPDRPILEALKPYLAERQTLLVLDNVEQLLPPAADLVAELIQAAPPPQAWRSASPNGVVTQATTCSCSPFTPAIPPLP